MHAYDLDGSPRHFVDNKSKGGQRDTTLRDIKKHGWVPSVTEILKVAAAPGLTNWLLGQAYMAMATLPEIEGESPDDRIKRAKVDASTHAKEARDKGSAIHAALEQWYGGKPVSQYMGYVEAVANELEAQYGITQGDLESEKTFATDGFGGAVDLSGPEFIIDFKTKSSEWKDVKKLAYDEHVAQLAAYRHGLGHPEAKLVNVFISPSKGVYCHEWSEDEGRWGLDYFNACYALWRLAKRYD